MLPDALPEPCGKCIGGNEAAAYPPKAIKIIIRIKSEKPTTVSWSRSESLVLLLDIVVFRIRLSCVQHNYHSPRGGSSSANPAHVCLLFILTGRSLHWTLAALRSVRSQNWEIRSNATPHEKGNTTGSRLPQKTPQPSKPSVRLPIAIAAEIGIAAKPHVTPIARLIRQTPIQRR